MDLQQEITTEAKKDITSDNSTLYAADSPFALPLRIESFSSEKDMDKFIKYTEKIVRNSLEYRYWVSFITENLGCNTCVLTKESLSETNIDVHHHPVSLYTVCKAVLAKKLNTQKQFCSFDIATEVIELHFQNKVGYMTLLSDIHQKFHDGYQELPIDFVHGDFRYITSNYPIEETEIQRIASLCNVKAADMKQRWSKDNYPGLNP